MNVTASARERVTTALARTIYDNPVVVKEFRSRMRGWKAFVTMGAYGGLMSVVLLIAYYSIADAYSRYPGGRSMHVVIGGSLFVALTWAQAILLTLIVPALSSSSLTHELEKKTIEMLALTPLSAGRIVLGKQFADFVYTLMLLACSLPLAGICLMLGGISPEEIEITYALLAAWTFLLTCSGIMWSSLVKKTATASATTFGLSMLYFIYTAAWGSPLMYVMYSGTSRGYAMNPLTLMNPAWASYGSLLTATVCGVKVPLALVAFTLHVACGVMYLLIATSHVLHKPAERALPIRLILLGMSVFTVWLIAGSTWTGKSAYSVYAMGANILYAAMIVAVIYATGAIKKPEKGSMLSYGLSLRRVFKSDVGGAIGFVVLYAAVTYAAFGVTMLFYQGGAAGTPPWMRHAGALAGSSKVHFWPAYFHTGVPIVAVAAGMAAVGVLASSLVKRRNAAAALLVLFGVVALVGYTVIELNFGVTSDSSTMSLLALLSPITPIYTSCGMLEAGTLGEMKSAWLATSLIYLLIGLAALRLAGPAYAKTGGVVEE